MCINQKGEIITGRNAKDQYLLRPEDTVMEVKRLMGSGQKTVIGGKEYTPEQISSYILKYLKEYAQDHIGEEVTSAVITVPAYFTDSQRKATVEAGKLAGLKVERIINEPTAAALAYGIDHLDNNSHIMVYDLGGGTLDVTVLEMFDGVLEVKASSGNNTLGGKDFDQRLIDYLVGEFEKKQGIDISDDIEVIARLKNEAEQCKISLSSQESYKVSLPFAADRDGVPVSIEEEITRDNFEQMISDLIESTGKPVSIALKDSGLEKEDIDLVLLVGGSTKIPCVKKFLQSVMAREPQSIVDPDLAVVTGAVIQAGIISNELSEKDSIIITDVCPYTLGVETMEHIRGIPVFDRFDVIIPRNTTIPVSKKEEYATTYDNQQSVDVKAYQGDYSRASRNSFLGEFRLSGIPPAPAHKEKIDIMFTYDINGILQVDAVIVSTGKKAGITISTNEKDTAEEIDLDTWKDAPGAKKYGGIIRRGESALKTMDTHPLKTELDDAIKELKRAIIRKDSKIRLEELEQQVSDLLYDMEDV